MKVKSLTLALALLLALAACAPAQTERAAIVTITREALGVEANRDDGLTYLVRRFGPELASGMFLNGFQRDGEPSFASARELQSQMLLLDFPPSLQSVKDSLVQAYRLEIEAAQLHRQGLEFGSGYFRPRIDRSNVDSSVYLSGQHSTDPWIIAQKLRRDTYIKWAQLLREHGIDAAKEGFTPLLQN